MNLSDLTGLGGIADVVNTTIQRIWPDKTAQQVQELAAAVAIVQGQLGINSVEAASPAVFVAGWRPFIGWVCGVGCAWNWIGLPAALFLCAAIGRPVTGLAAADLSQMWPLLGGMLGLGALRTYEKVKGVA